MTVFVIACVLAELNNSFDIGVEFGLATVVAPLVSFLGYFAARLIVKNLEDLREFLKGFIIPSIPVSLIGLAQVTGFAGFDRLVLAIAPAEGAERRLDVGGLTRATSLIGHWTGLGTYLTVILTAVCILAIVERRLGRARPGPLAYTVLAVGAIGLVSTFTFSTVITGAVVLIVSWRAAGFGSRIVFLAAPAAMLSAILLGNSIAFRFDQQSSTSVPGAEWIPVWLPDTLQYRIRVWTEQTIPMIESRPAQGWGSDLYGTPQPGRVYPSLLDWGSSESQWFGTAIAYGLFAMLALVGVLIAVFYVLAMMRKILGPPEVAMVRSLGWLLTMTIVTSLTVSAFTNRGFPAAFWPLLGACLAYALGVRAERFRSQTHTSIDAQRADKS